MKACLKTPIKDPCYYATNKAYKKRHPYHA